MREYLISHGWLLIPATLVGIFLVAAGLFAVGNVEQNFCTGFRYFTFVDQRETADSYMVQLLNGNKPIIVTSVEAGPVSDSNPYVSEENIQPGRAFAIRTISMEPSGTTRSDFNNMALVIHYDVINGAVNLTDRAVCSGMVA